jgi:hypothetical protein
LSKLGKKCGATFIDRNFYDLMSRRFGEAFTKRPFEKTGPGSNFMEDFQRIKHNFSTANRTTELIHLKMPGLDENEIDGSKYNFEEDEILISWSVDDRSSVDDSRAEEISRGDLRSCFDPVINQIIDLIQQQVAATEENNYPKIQVSLAINHSGSS